MFRESFFTLELVIYLLLLFRVLVVNIDSAIDEVSGPKNHHAIYKNMSVLRKIYRVSCGQLFENAR